MTYSFGGAGQRSAAPVVPILAHVLVAVKHRFRQPVSGIVERRMVKYTSKRKNMT
jgi:hypothetical protein